MLTVGWRGSRARLPAGRIRVVGWFVGPRLPWREAANRALMALGAAGLVLVVLGRLQESSPPLPAAAPGFLRLWPWRPAPRPGPPEPPPPPSPLAGLLVVVDPGHGGIDAGVRFGDLLEKEINLDLALRLSRRLEADGARVRLTRQGDETLDLSPRAGLALRMEQAREADLFVSIHANSFPDSSQFGAQAFYYPSSAEGRRLALLVQEELVRLHPDNYRQALPADYFVLRNSPCPAVLVEVGFLSNPDDRRRLGSPEWRESLAEAVFRALERFQRGEQPAPEPMPALQGAGPPPGFILHIYHEEAF